MWVLRNHVCPGGKSLRSVTLLRYIWQTSVPGICVYLTRSAPQLWHDSANLFSNSKWSRRLKIDRAHQHHNSSTIDDGGPLACIRWNDCNYGHCEISLVIDINLILKPSRMDWCMAVLSRSTLLGSFVGMLFPTIGGKWSEYWVKFNIKVDLCRKYLIGGSVGIGILGAIIVEGTLLLYLPVKS